MKVLFAVHDEKVSLSIVKKYQKEYKEIISYKNVYYFNAILKELQRDKTYDRIVIDEELEEFTSSSYEQKDKFIFDKLDNITDEASNANGKDMPIILICSERRSKSEEILVRLFGIGIYNAIIGNDRSTDEVCRLINRPRSKKEAKIYYKIDVEDVSYRPESEDEVSEEEMQHILSYFKKLGKNEEKYVACFRNIASQYNEKQLGVIISILPLNVRAILEESSPEYQKIVATNGGYLVGNSAKKEKEVGTSEILLTDKKAEQGRPIVVPSKMDKTLIKKLTLKRPSIATKIKEEDFEEDIPEFKNLPEINEEENETKKEKYEPEILETPKRGRGRPRKNPLPEIIEEESPKPKRGRGRPRKNPIIEERKEETQAVLPGFEDLDEDEFSDIPSIDDIVEENEKKDIEDNDEFAGILPGIDDEENLEEELDDEENGEEDTTDLDNFDDLEENVEQYEIEEQDDEPVDEEIEKETFNKKKLPEENKYENYDYSEYDSLLSSTRKVITFVGTGKNGTSFVVNNIAKILSNNGIDTAILDATKNKNAYYIYTKNEETLRQQAYNSIGNIINGVPDGIQVNENLTVYTELPGHESKISNVGPILENLVKRHSAVLIDCDFETPIEYFEKAQEIYLIQSMDVLTIQPLTAFLRELKIRNIINESKIKIILNKVVKVKRVSAKTIIGGMSNYNDPEMSFMTELFDRDSIVARVIPFDIEVYQNYLEQIIDCEIRTDKYPKDFQKILNDLSNIVYPVLPNKKVKEKSKKGYQYDGFSESVNNTLNNMKKKY